MTIVEAHIKREKKKSNVSMKLFELLKSISDDNDFIGGTFADLKTDEERQLIIDYIEKGEDVNEEQIILNSIWIAQHTGHAGSIK